MAVALNRDKREKNSKVLEVKHLDGIHESKKF